MTGLAFDPARRDERFDTLLRNTEQGTTISNLRRRLQQAEAFSNGDERGYVPQDPKEIMADVLSLLRHAGVRW